jgi:putative toxin-antitoxin system antitoxin component (TIGR02293 family)
MKKYPEPSDDLSNILMKESGPMPLIYQTRQGINFDSFVQLAGMSPFNIQDWSKFLHLSERTMQRYKKEKKRFGPIYAEKIIEITMLQKYGTAVFGNDENYAQWMEINNIALDGSKPKDFLDSTFGIKLIRQELGRIEHGILA